MATVNGIPDALFAAPESASCGPTISIQAQNIAGHAQVHNGPAYLIRRSSTFNSQRQAIFRWLSPLSFHSTHQRIKDEAHIIEQYDSPRDDRYSGKWLLDSDTLDSWRSGHLKKLWYIGMPGAGKSVLASIIISNLLELQQTLKEGRSSRIAYLYLSYKETQSLEHLLGSVVKQLVGEETQLPEALLELWKTRKQGDESATCHDLSGVIERIVQEHQSYIVVDALDECPQSFRLRLMQELQPKSDKLSILVTSRYLDEFKDISREFRQEKIQAHPSDLDLFIDQEFNNTSRLRELSGNDPSLQDQVKTAVKNACQGMFLLASLHMKSIAAELSTAGVRARLTRLPRGIEDLYDDGIARIKTMKPNETKLALDTLSWIVFSYRPLTVTELRHALAVVPTNMKFDSERMFREDDIRDLCGGLVAVADGVVSLVHYAAQTYFDGIRHLLFPGFQFTIAQTCIAYLSLADLEDPDDVENEMSHADGNVDEVDSRPPQQIVQPQQSSEQIGPARLSYEQKCTKFPFLLYAGEFLGRHLRQLTRTTPDYSISTLLLLLKLLRERPKRNFLIRVMSDYNLMAGDLPSLSQTESSDFIWEYRWDSGQSRESLSDESSSDDDQHSVETSEADSDIPLFRRSNTPRRQVCSGITPLHLAAFLGWPPIVGPLTKLSEESSNINAVDEYGRTPLAIAVREGHWEFVPTLLEHGAKVELQTGEGHSVLLYMAEQDQQDAILKVITNAIGDIHLAATSSDILGEFLCFARIRRMWVDMLWSLAKLFRLSCEKTPTDSRSLSHDLELLRAATTDDHLSIRRLVQERHVDFKDANSVFHTTALFLAVEFNNPSSVEKAFPVEQTSI